MSKKLAYKLEKIFIALHRQHPVLNGMRIDHHDKADKAATVASL